MPELTREEKLNLVEKLPQELQDLLFSEDTGAFLLYLGQKYNLPKESVRLLSKLTGDVVLGIVPVTSLAQEINSKILPDVQAATNLAQEMYNELLAPALIPSFSAPAQPAPPAPIAPAPIPAAPAAPIAPPIISAPMPPKLDRYREPTSSTPEIVDLRKAPAPAPPTPPLSFQRPAEVLPAPLAAPVAPTPPAAPAPVTPMPPATQAAPTTEPRPQYILRPSGSPPADFPDFPDNVLDLRKDKGEF